MTGRMYAWQRHTGMSEGDAMRISANVQDHSIVRRLYVTAVTATIVVVSSPAFGQVTGGIDPETALSNLETYGFGAAGAAISLICLFKGSHAVAEGRHLFPFIGGALGGIILAFGGPYILQRMGVG